MFLFVIYSAFVGFSWSANFYSVFGITQNSGVLVPYKMLRGTTMNGVTTFVRVNQAFRFSRGIAAPINSVGAKSVSFDSRLLRTI